MNRPLRIAIAKPDFRVTGGFELVMARVESELKKRGHDISWHTVDVHEVTRAPYALDVPAAVWAAAPEYFRYLALVEAFRAIDLPGADVVLTTQPPSFAVDHPRTLAVFYHHLRIYYDLSDAYVEAGFVEPEVHECARTCLRAVDQPLLESVRHLLAPSTEVERRLAEYNGLRENVSLYQAGVAFRRSITAAPGKRGARNVLCVSRHEWPKRTELFVEAMKHLPDLRGTMVGGGGRLAWAKQVDAQLSAPGADLGSVDSRALWMNRGELRESELAVPVRSSNVEFLGHISDGRLDRLFTGALCVVAPAYLEDYGLTAIEAMTYGKPVIVCADGGGLVDTVEDGVNGFVVEPTGAAIAAAVRRLSSDHDLAATMADNAREQAATYTWERAMQQLDDGLERVLS